MNRYVAILVLLVALVTGCAQPVPQVVTPEPEKVAEQEIGYGDITGDQLVSMIGDDTVLIVDVRTAEEYAQGHLEGAINIPVDKFQTSFDDLDLSKDQPLALYCRTGNRSSLAYLVLENQGYDKVYHAPSVSQYDYPLVK